MHRFIDQDGRLDRLRTLLERGQCVELVGPAGIGKSRVLDEVAWHLGVDGFDVESIKASSVDLSVPFTPFAHLVTGDHAPATSTEQLALLLGTFSERISNQRFVMLVDDAQRLDPLSIELLHQVMVRFPIPVVLAFRSDEDIDDRLRAAVRGRNGWEIELRPFDRTGCADLAVAALGERHGGSFSEVDGRVVDGLIRLSDGNPFFAIELLNAGVENGALSIGADGVWRLARSLEAPPRLHEVILARLDSLPSEQREVLEVLAVTGGLPLVALHRLVSTRHLADLERLGLLRCEEVTGRTRVDVGHDIYREVLLAGSVIRLAEARHRAVAALSTLTTTHPDLCLLAARISLEMGSIEPDLALAGARVALRNWDPALAVQLSRMAGPGPEARLLAAAALGAAGLHADAEATFAELQMSAPDDVRARAFCEHALYLIQDRGSLDRALGVLRGGVDDCAVPHDELVRCTLALTQVVSGTARDALATLGPVLERDGPIPPMAGPALAAAWVVTGDPRSVMRTWDQVWATVGSEHLEQIDTIGLYLVWNRLLALTQLGRAAEGDDPAGTVPDHIWWPGRASPVVTIGLPAVQAYLRGHLGRARDLLMGIEGVVGELSVQARIGSSAMVAHLHAQLGDAEVARLILSSLDELPEDALAGYGYQIDRAWAWLSASEGDTTKAVEASIRLADEHDGDWFHVTTSLHDVVRLGRAAAVVERLVTIGERDGATWFDMACRDHALAAATSDPVSLMDVSTHFGDGGLDLLALEAAAQASDASVDRPGISLDARRRVAELTAVCAGARTPALETQPAVLTEREAEVARFAARGWTNARIAERLGTSSRTVGNQLQSVYHKLHISSRGELSEMFPEATRSAAQDGRGSPRAS